MKRYAVYFLKFGISVILLSLVFYHFNFSDFFETLSRVSPLGIIAAIFLGMIQMVLHIWRWQLVTLVLGSKVPFGAIARFTLVGLFYNQALPTSFGGDAVRIAMVRPYCSSISQAILGVFLDRVIALIVLVCMIAVCLPLLPDLISNPNFIWSLSAVIVFILASICLVIIFGPSARKILAQIPLIGRASPLLSNIRHCLITLPEAPVLTVCSLIMHLLTCIIIYLISADMDVTLSIFDSLVLVPTITLIAALPVSFAGWGIREGAMIYLLGQVGVAGADAMAISVAFGLLLLGLSLPGAILWMVKSPHAGKLGAKEI